MGEQSGGGFYDEEHGIDHQDNREDLLVFVAQRG